MLNNYFVWIANFGVVPLLRLAAFLFFPAAFTLFSLLVVVTFVLETITYLLITANYSINFIKLCFIRSINLSKISQCVKILIFLGGISLWEGPLFAQEMLSVAMGHSKEIYLKTFSSYAIKNPELLNITFQKKENKIVISAKKIGVTELAINEGGKTQKYLVKVHNEMALKNFKTSMGFSSIFSKDKEFLQGEVQELATYRLLKKLEKENPNIKTTELTLSSKVKKIVWLEIYKKFLNLGFYDIDCEFQNITLKCFEISTQRFSASLKKSLEENWFINIEEYTPNALAKNFEVKLKIIALENTKGQDIHLGLDQLSGSLIDFFNMSLVDIVGKNEVLLNQQKIEMSVLAEPKFITIANIENKFSVGSEIPFNIKNEQGRNQVTFKFAGLSVKLKIEELKNNILINYETELSKPEMLGETMAINGNKQSTSLIISPNNAEKLFEIEFTTEHKATSSLPGLSNIPILGKLFESKTNRDSYKKIIGLIQVIPNGK